MRVQRFESQIMNVMLTHENEKKMASEIRSAITEIEYPLMYRLLIFCLKTRSS